MKKTTYQLLKMKVIFQARTNGFIKETTKNMIEEMNKNWNFDYDILDYLNEEKLERIWRNLYQWKLPKNITISWTDEYFIL